MKCKAKMVLWMKLILILTLTGLSPISSIPAVHADTKVGGPVTSDTTWTTTHSPYVVVESVEVSEGVTLTIEPGVTVRFDSGKKLQVSGGLVAQGTADNLIHFTSNQPAPAPGDWGNIEFTGTAITTTMDVEGNYVGGSILQYCVVEYAGADVSSVIEAHSLLIDHCTVRNNDARGIYNVGTVDAPVRITSSTVAGNSVADQSFAYGGGIYATRGIVSDNTVNENSVVVYPPTYGGIYVSGSIARNNTVDGKSTADHLLAYGGGIYAASSVVSNNTVSGNSVSYNSILGCFFTAYGGGIYAFSSTVSDNTVEGNWANGGLFTAYGGGIYALEGKVSANIISGNLVSGGQRAYGGGIFADNSIVNHNIVSNNASRGSRYCATTYGGGIYSSQGTVSNNTISGNLASAGHSAHGGGIYASGSTVSKNIVSDNSTSSGLSGAGGGGIYASEGTVSGNTVGGNSVVSNLGSSGGGIYASDGMVNDNIVSGNSVTGTIFASGGGIYASGSSVLTNTIIANTVAGGNSHGSGAIGGSYDFLFNTVAGNRGPLSQTVGGLDVGGTSQVHYNNFYGNKPYDVTVVASDDISGTHNYWGTVSSLDILDQIYDWNDDSGRGLFLYMPHLQKPSSDAPFPPPINLTADFQDGSVVLSWDAPPGLTTGWGHKVYYDTDSSSPPYEGTGLIESDSPLDVGGETSYTLTGLDPCRDYYFTVTTYDNEGHESWYSNVTWKQGGCRIYLPAILKLYATP